MATAQVTRRGTQRKRKPYRNYDVDQRAIILASLDANHGNVAFTAEQHGINESTLRSIIQDARRDTERGRRVRALREEKRGQLAEALEDTAWEALQQTRDRLPEASARDAAVCLGIVTEKALLLRGQPTVIVGHVDARLAGLDDAALAAIERDIVDRARRQQQESATITVDSAPIDSSDVATPCTPVAVSARQRINTGAERARDGGGRREQRVAVTVEQPVDGALRQTGAARELPRGDPLVQEHGAEARGESHG